MLHISSKIRHAQKKARLLLEACLDPSQLRAPWQRPGWCLKLYLVKVSVALALMLYDGQQNNPETKEHNHHQNQERLMPFVSQNNQN